MQTRRLLCSSVITIILVASAAIPAFGASIVFSATGAQPSDIQSTVDAYRTALGPLNPNVVGSFAGGRREINWDGVPDALSAPNNLPGNFFNSNSPRGVAFATPGTGFQVSANAAVGPVEFGNIDPNYPTFFRTFSAQRLFTALGSPITDVSFFVPGTANAGFTSGFGAVFTDVDLANISSLAFFDLNNNSLGTFVVPNVAGNETLSFLAVLFNAGEKVGRVRITSGNQVLASGNTASDLVVMDDFIFAEPQAAVPEPATISMGAGLLALIAFRRFRKL